MVESIISKTSKLAEYFANIRQIADDLDCDVYWRGQADQSWGIRSSLVRRLSSDALTDASLEKVELAILKESMGWMAATEPGLQSNLEWLAFLQHNWVPTRLIDFTPDPLIATFFACESLDDVDGRIFATLVKRGDEILDGSVDFDVNDTPSGAIRVFKPRKQVSPRLAAQSGVFILGKLPSTQVSRQVDDDLVGRRLMLKDEVASIMSLPFYFRQEGEQARSTSSAVASYTARIHINKASVRRELRGGGNGRRYLVPPQPVDHAFCYPDVDGMRRYSRVWAEVFAGASSLH
jgi:hypothetical protein